MIPDSIPSSMNAWMLRRYGGPEMLQLTSIPTPMPGPHDVLIRVEATTVSSGDRRLRAMDFPPGMKTLGRLIFGIRGPRRPVLGTECTGTIVAIGAKVTRFTVGDAVIAFPDAKMGAHAEYLRMAEGGILTQRPASFAQETAASLCFGGLTALDFLRRADVKAGERILVIGASGTVGSALVQLAVHQGAQVTAVTSTVNVERARALGAQRVIDYTKQGMSENGELFDVIADAVGAIDFKTSLSMLPENGRYLAINGGIKDMLAGKRGSRRCIAGPARATREALETLIQLVQSGHFRPLIDRVVAFSDLPAAHARADSGRKTGSVVVTLP